MTEETNELLKKIDELEENLAGAEQAVQEGLEINEELNAENNELSNKVLQLEKKLAISVRALDFFINPVATTAFKGSDAILKEFRTGAKKVLKQIKEVK